MPETKFKEDVELDANMVFASMGGVFVPFAISVDMTPDEAYGRAVWMKRQPETYLMQVVNRVAELMEAESKKEK